MTTTVNNISKSQTLKVGATTITAQTITGLPVTGVHGFHDCSDPSQISVLNAVWPTTYKGGSGLKNNDVTNLANSAVSISVVNGLTINMHDNGAGNNGNVSVTFT
jgi:hypothetical protein